MKTDMFDGRESVFHNVLAMVMTYDDATRQWVACGSQLQYANIYVLFNEAAKTYRFYGIDGKDGEVIINHSVLIILQFSFIDVVLCCTIHFHFEVALSLLLNLISVQSSCCFAVHYYKN